MHRRTCLRTRTLLSFAWPTSHAADDVEGRWLAEVGPPDNRARVGLELELERGADGTLRARYTIDLLNFYGECRDLRELRDFRERRHRRDRLVPGFSCRASFEC